MRDGDHGQTVDAGEAVGIARVNRQVVGERGGGDHRVERPLRRLAAGTAQGCGDVPEPTSSGSVEDGRVDVGLCLLEVSLTGRSLLAGHRHQRTDRELGERDDASTARRAASRVGDPPEQD